MKKHYAWLLCAALVGGGCATMRPVETQTRLGSVIIYRNGVAYFERYAERGEKELRLRVPSERVDDFLTSLSIVDDKTGEALPVSYPTLESFDGYVEMSIALPPQHGRLKVTYVTESPAWKPSYRIVLEEDGKARLQGWAVVDNVSGEDWKNVKVGVGSTSALTFRYDMHSVRLVERQLLSTGELLANAGPTGGSPYAVATRGVRVLGSLADADLDGIPATGMAFHGADGTLGGLAVGVRAQAEEVKVLQTVPGVASNTEYSKKPEKPTDSNNAQRDERQVKVKGKRYWEGLRVQAGKHRIRVEGYAQNGDADPQNASVARANAVKEKLIANGVPGDRIDVVGTGVVNTKEAARVLATDDEVVDTSKADEAEKSARDTLPVGHAHFVSDAPMSIKSEHSAMVSMLNDLTQAKRVFYYDPISARGSKRYAFNAVRITNPSKFTLDPGPFTIYAKGQFLGEGLSDAILPKSSAFIPYALDQSVLIEPGVDTREEIESLVTIQRGVVTTESRRIRRTKLSVANRGKQAAEVYVRHKVEQGFTLTKTSEAKVEKLNGAHLFSVDVAGGQATELIIEEWSPLMKTVDIRTDDGIRDMALFLRSSNIDAQLKGQIEAVITKHREAANLQEHIDVLDEQLEVYRTRSDELNVQLATLKKVAEAAKLRSHLQQKMEEISTKIQTGTLELSDLKGQLMALRIDLQDRLAELTLKKKEDDAVAQN